MTGRHDGAALGVDTTLSTSLAAEEPRESKITTRISTFLAAPEPVDAGAGGKGVDILVENVRPRSKGLEAKSSPP
jgi:hypothetical protein